MWLGEHDMTVAVDWDVNHQTKTKTVIITVYTIYKPRGHLPIYFGEFIFEYLWLELMYHEFSDFVTCASCIFYSYFCLWDAKILFQRVPGCNGIADLS